jgi:hypothetical protein
MGGAILLLPFTFSWRERGKLKTYHRQKQQTTWHIAKGCMFYVY